MPRAKMPTLQQRIEDMRADFRAGKDTRFVSRLTGVSSAGSGQDYHYRSESQWLHMMERARHYQRNDQVVGQAIRRVVANIVQDGFRLDPRTGDVALDAEIKARWEEWSRDQNACHSEGELTFSQMEAMALSSIIVDGDCFALPLKTGSIQWLEAHRCRTPRRTTRNVVHGVQMDDNRRRLAYWFTREDIDPSRTVKLVSDVSIYPVRDADGRRQVLHLYLPYRFSQTRGVSMLSPVSDTVGMHDDVQFATLVKAQMQALVALLRQRSEGWQPVSDQQMGPQTTETVGGYTRTIEGVGAGMEIAGDPGETLSMFSANIPNAEFFPHTRLLLTFIAINLDIPVHVLLLDPSQTNFSGWRGAIDQARLRFRQIQNWLVEQFHEPVYEWWIRWQIARDPAMRAMANRDTVNLLGYRWNSPQFPYIDPEKDAQADDMQISRLLNSRRRIQASRGRQQSEVAREIVEDNVELITLAAEAAERLAAQGIDVDWREVLSLPLPDKASASLPLQTGRSSTDSTDNDPPQSPTPTNGHHPRFSINGHHG